MSALEMKIWSVIVCGANGNFDSASWQRRW